MSENDILKTLLELTEKDKLSEIRNTLDQLNKKIIGSDSIQLGGGFNINSAYLQKEIEQIIKTQTIERSKYYLQRLIKSLTQIKTGKINDLNLNRWKEYDDIITDSLWIIKKRDTSGSHSAGYWGNFIPQIPNQLIRRYTKKNEWVLDPFLGSGTTLIESQRLERNGVGVELIPSVAKLAQKNLDEEKRKSKTEIIVGDSSGINLKRSLSTLGIKSVQLVIMHPPYWDIIKFSEEKSDLSNCTSLNEFLESFGKVIDNVSSVLDKGRYLAVIIGDKYSDGEWIPLGFYSMQEVIKRGYVLKSTVVKNFEDTRGKMKQKELWRYRALVGGFYVFKHEYIFIFKKK
ncbi:MAG: DNA methyltransferase [Ignavibacteriales bacterium]|nr:MAG: DNA methyltransferase [Ignavibacteriales bacterium]